jgi:hypothetical protein
MVQPTGAERFPISQARAIDDILLGCHDKRREARHYYDTTEHSQPELPEWYVALSFVLV